MEALELSNLKEISGGDETFVSDMLRIYLKNLPGMIDPLKLAFDSENLADVIRWSHKLKSASGAAGAVAILQHADIIEQMALMEAPFQELIQQQTELQEAIEVTLPVINSYLEQQK